MKWKKLILLGDSNTQFGWGKASGWSSDLADLLQRKCDVINRGFSGYNSDKIKIILPRIFDEFNSESICGVIIMLGSNDSTKDTNKIQHVPLARFESNLKYIIDYLKKLGINEHKIILISPPKIDDAKWEATVNSRNHNEHSDHFDHLVTPYAQAVKKVATEKKTIFLDFNGIMADCGDDYKECLFDGLHLSDKGSELLYENLLPIVNQHIADHLKYNFPYWKDIKPDQIEINQF
jgi:lysophospholipase L1-like esterase